MVDRPFETAADDRSALQPGIGNRFFKPCLLGKVFWDWFFDLAKPMSIATTFIPMPTPPLLTTIRITKFLSRDGFNGLDDLRARVRITRTIAILQLSETNTHADDR